VGGAKLRDEEAGGVTSASQMNGPLAFHTTRSAGGSRLKRRRNTVAAAQ
jgi:hypothetical protein